MAERLDAPLPRTLRAQLRWWRFRAWLRRCPECGQRGYGIAAPRWEDDRVARMLGLVTPDRCRCCGKGYGTGAPENLPTATEADPR